MSALIAIAKEAASDFQRHKAQWLAAAIAYYTLFAIAPLIIVLVEIAGLFLGEHQRALHALYGYLASTAGTSAAQGIEAIVTATFSQRRSGLAAQIVGWTVFVAGTIGLFASLQDALNTVWDVTPEKRTLLQTLAMRLVSFGAVLAIAFLLLVSLGVNALLTMSDRIFAGVFPAFPALLKVVDFGVSLGMITVLFALIYAVLPDRHIAWRDVWLGAFVSAVLFVLGEFVLGWYLGRGAASAGYGSFAGLIVFLIWVNYSAQIVLFGAEVTHVYSRRFGSLRSPESLHRHA